MFKFLKMASIAGLCGVLMINTTTSKAAIVNYSFTGAIDSGLLTGETYNGSFGFDNATLTNFGSQSISLTSFIFNFLSSSFSLANADLTPTADFLNGAFLGISFTSLTTNIDPTFSFVSASGTGLPDDKPYLGYQTNSGDSGYGSLNFPQVAAPSVKTVPMPSGAIWLLAGGLGLLSIISRRQKRLNS